jgi:hypothetical protein
LGQLGTFRASALPLQKNVTAFARPCSGERKKQWYFFSSPVEQLEIPHGGEKKNRYFWGRAFFEKSCKSLATGFLAATVFLCGS